MEETTARNAGLTDSISAYLEASEAALNAAQRLNQAWRRYFEASAEAPSTQWVAEVAALQMKSELALLQARALESSAASPSVVAGGSEANTDAVVVKTRRRRRRENKFLGSIGRPGQKLLRFALIILLIASALVATGAGISLALEIAGFLHLIDDPVQLPIGIQLAIFLAATGLAMGFRRMLKSVDRALYGSKGIRPEGFTL